MTIRILHIVTYMGRGGLETMLMNYYRNIDREKVQFDFLVHRDFEADYDKEILSMGGKIYRLPRLNPFDNKYRKAIKRFFSEHKEFNIVHSHLDCMSAIPLKYAEQAGVPVRIAHAHNSNQSINIKYPMKLFYKKQICKYATNLFACGNASGEWMFGTKDFYVLNNAIDSKLYSFDKRKRDKVRRELNIARDTLLIGHVGRFADAKNHKFLIKVFFELLNKQKNSLLILVGDGDLRKDIEKQIIRLGISDKVIFAGMRKDVPDLLTAMDVFLFPSKYEGLPLSVVEAQASGLPCVISDKVPPECVITDSVFIQNLDEGIEKWVECVEECATLPRIDRYDDLCRAGYDIEKNAENLENIYLRLSEEIHRNENIDGIYSGLQ